VHFSQTAKEKPKELQKPTTKTQYTKQNKKHKKFALRVPFTVNTFVPMVYSAAMQKVVHNFKDKLELGKIGEQMFADVMRKNYPDIRLWKTPEEIDRHFKFDFWSLLPNDPRLPGPKMWEVKYDEVANHTGNFFFETMSVTEHKDGKPDELGWAKYGGSAADYLCYIIPWSKDRTLDGVGGAVAYIFDLHEIQNLVAPGGGWCNFPEKPARNEKYVSLGVTVDAEIVEAHGVILNAWDVPI
jgi:hypothetical protein